MSEEEIKNAWDQASNHCFPPSFKVDFCQFIAGIKPAIRTRISERHKIQPFFQYALKVGWFPVLDDKNFLVFSKNENLSRVIMGIDQAPYSHAADLGVLLGYPICCSKFIEKCGEKEIDNIAKQYNREYLKGHFSLLDISQYLKGIALISHVPCSYECKPSLNLALASYSFIKKNNSVDVFKDWASLVNNYFIS